MKRTMYILAAGIILLFLGFSSLEGKAAEIVKEGYTLDFNDEFDGTSLDRTKWTDVYLPHWCDDPETARGNLRFENGCLVEYITQEQQAWCPEHDGTVRSSAIMSFDKSWIHNFSGTTDNHDRPTWYGYTTKYGYFELRAKLANCGGGGHQAWWMVGMQQDTDDWFNSRQTAEIDILETFFTTPNVWRIASYGWNDPEFQNFWGITVNTLPSGNPTEEFHTYAMDWTPSYLKFYYDGQLIRTIYDSPDYEMGTILNIYTDAGSGVHNDVWPKEWYIDYFRVWKRNGGYENWETDQFMIQNRQTGKFAYIDPDTDYVKYGAVDQTNEAYAKWNMERNGEYVLIKNAETGEYLNIEGLSGLVEHTKVPRTYWSAQWKEDVNSDGYTRLINRWKPEYAIHTEDDNGSLQYGSCPDTWWSSQWKFLNI